MVLRVSWTVMQESIGIQPIKDAQIYVQLTLIFMQMIHQATVFDFVQPILLPRRQAESARQPVVHLSQRPLGKTTAHGGV